MEKEKEQSKTEVKFKPISPTELEGEQKQKVAEILKQVEKNPVVDNKHGLWKEYIAWWEGNQYVFYNSSSGELEDVSSIVPREVKNTYNRITSMVRQMWGEIRYPHSFYVEPNTTESEDINASKLGSHVIEYTNIKGKFNHKINYAKLWALITGNIFWKEWWNPNLEGYIRTDKGELVIEKGDIDYNFVNPFNIRLDPLALTRDGWRNIIELKQVAKSSLEDEFGLARGTLSSEAKEDLGEYTFERTSETKTDEETNIRIEYWERPNKSRKKGRFMVVNKSGWLFEDKDNPAPKHDIPYFQIPGILPRLNDQYYDSIVRLLQTAQRQLNRYCSMVDEHIQYHKPKAMIPRGTLDPTAFKKYTRSGVDFIEYDPVGIRDPHWQSPPQLPEIIINWLTFQEKEIETEGSVREVSLARLPKYSTRASGVLYRGLKQQDEKVLIPTIEDIDMVLQDAMKFRLQLIQKHYKPARLVKISGKNKATASIFLKGTELRDNSDVRVKAGVGLFSQREEKNEVVSMLIEKGLITDPRKALELLDTKGLEEFMEGEFIDERQAERENEMLKEGKVYPLVHPDDNHAVHYRVHNDARKTDAFNLWSKDSKLNHEKHLESHKLRMKAAVADLQKNQMQTTEQPTQQGGGTQEALLSLLSKA